MKKSKRLEEALQVVAEENVKYEKSLGNKRFLCGCGKMHAIKTCDAIQSHYYTPPSGCTGGDYWNTGEIYIICPLTKQRNRLLYKSYWEVDYENREKYAYNAEKQFRRLFSSKFKSITPEHNYENERSDLIRQSWNNYYIDQNHKKFDIEIAK